MNLQSSAIAPRGHAHHWLLLSVLVLLAAVIASPTGTAHAAITAQCTPAEQTLSERINAAVAPVTDFVSGLIFTEIPIPGTGGGKTARAELRLKEGRLREGALVRLEVGGVRHIFEFDRDGIVCDGNLPVEMATTTAATAELLRDRLLTIHGDQLTKATVVPAEGQTRIELVAPVRLSPHLSTSDDGLAASEFTDGSVGMPLIVLWLLLGAVFFTLKMGFINLRGFRHAIQIARGVYDDPKDPGEVTHFQALTAALSGTVGLGNIAGVAIAISIGGPGATFWMIMAGLFGMSTKFTECTLGVKYRRIDKEGVVSGGPMYYLWLGLKKRGEWMGRFGRGLSIFFALLCLGAAFGAGNMFQVNQSTAQFMNVMVPWLFGPDSFMADMPWLVGLAYAILVGLVIIGGIRSIVQVTERLVPLMAFIYVGAALVVIFQHADMLPAAMAAIVTGAFTPLGVAGGFFGVLIQGIRRASFSNEAGVGSAAIAHSAVKTTEPVSEGMVALLEPFVDTVVICTMTAFVIIVTGMYQTAEAADGIALTSDAFATVLPWFPYILSIAVLMFAYSTSITYYYYGERAFLFLIGPDRKWAENAYKVAYLLVLIVGSSMQLTSVMDFADAMLLAMAFPNMVGLYIMAGEVKRDLDLYLTKVKRREIRPYREVLEEEGARG